MHFPYGILKKCLISLGVQQFQIFRSLWDDKTALHSWLSLMRFDFVFLLCVLPSGHSNRLPVLQSFMTSLWKQLLQIFHPVGSCSSWTLSLKSLKVILQMSIWGQSVSWTDIRTPTSLFCTLPFFSLPETPQSIPFSLFPSAKSSQANWCFGHLHPLFHQILWVMSESEFMFNLRAYIS